MEAWYVGDLQGVTVGDDRARCAGGLQALGNVPGNKMLESTVPICVRPQNAMVRSSSLWMICKALQIIHNELDLTMAFCGRTQIGTVDSSILLPGTFPKA